MLSAITPLTKYLRLKGVRIYDAIFVLHSKLTVCILLTCSILISAKQYFGDPINCLSDEKNIEFLTSFCWTIGTYIFDDFDKKVGEEVISVGVYSGIEGVSEKISLRYYQWVILVLLIQALFFFIPSFLWKLWEGGRLQQLCQELGCVIISDKWEKERKRALLTYFSHGFSDVHVCYALKYFTCELLNFAICIGNIVMMNVIFNGFWFNYAPALSSIAWNDWDRWNELSSRIFPKLAKCDFYKFGGSGTPMKIDALCLLPLNILNEKVFAFLWCWFLVLTVLSGLNVIFRIATMLSKRLRLHLLQAKVGLGAAELTERALNGSNVGDWFMLYKVSSNINPVLFRDLLKELNNIHDRSQC